MSRNAFHAGGGSEHPSGGHAGIMPAERLTRFCPPTFQSPTLSPLAQACPTQYSPSCSQDRRIEIESTTAPPREGSMTTAKRTGNVLTGLPFGAITSMGLLALPIAASHPAMAQNHGPAALAGTVSSTEEGKMEGVVVSAKRPGSTIMISVSTNAQGQYSFPQDRLAPRAYDITIRVAGYTLEQTPATRQTGGTTTIELRHDKAPPSPHTH